MKEYKNKCIDCGCRVDNRTKRCHPCYDKWRESTKEERKLKAVENQKAWYQQNKARILLKTSERSKSLSFQTRKGYVIKHKYGVDINKYNEMLQECNYQCMICNQLHTEDKPLHIDHCHTTGQIRGLLCNKCNQGLGFFKDSTILLNNAINYLTNEI